MSIQAWYQDPSVLWGDVLDFYPSADAHPYVLINQVVRMSIILGISLAWRYPRALFIPLLVAGLTIWYGLYLEEGHGNIIGENGLACQAPSAANPYMEPQLWEAHDRKPGCSMTDPVIARQANAEAIRQLASPSERMAIRTYEPDTSMDSSQYMAALRWMYPPGSFRKDTVPTRVI